MATKIIHKKSSVASSAPVSADIAPGELALNLADQKIYSKQTDGTIVEMNGGTAVLSYEEKSGTYSAGANEGIIANTSSGPWTLTLPASPTSGDEVIIVDGADFSSNNLTVARNGSTIAGLSEDLTVDLGNIKIHLIYAFGDWQVSAQVGIPSLESGITSIEDNGNATAITIDSNENVGIGTSSPSGELEVKSTGDADLYIRSGDANAGSIYFASASDSQEAAIRYFNSNNSLRFYGHDMAEAMRIDSSGNVGIGASPSAPLHVFKNQASPTIVARFENPADEAIVEIKSKNTDLGVLQFADTEDANVGAVQYSHSENSMRFKTNDAEAMRIDSSGNVLVGKTSDDAGAGAGVINRANGRVYATVSGGEPAILNRLSSDGDIIDFKKDGSTVGSIGVSSDRIYLSGANEGIFIDDSLNYVGPSSASGGFNDATVGLGIATNRFKDLYLSGGVYLGGTGSANKLDDYEEGTWTPVFSDEVSGGNTATGSIRGLYTKIGNQVTVTCTAIGLSTSGMNSANDLRIQGLPFTASSYNSPNNYWQGATRFKNVNFNTNGWVSAFVLDATTYVRLGETVVGTGNDNITVSQILSSADVYFTLTYQTNS